MFIFLLFEFSGCLDCEPLLPFFKTFLYYICISFLQFLRSTPFIFCYPQIAFAVLLTVVTFSSATIDQFHHFTMLPTSTFFPFLWNTDTSFQKPLPNGFVPFALAQRSNRFLSSLFIVHALLCHTSHTHSHYKRSFTSGLEASINYHLFCC